MSLGECTINKIAKTLYIQNKMRYNNRKLENKMDFLSNHIVKDGAQ